MKNQRLFHLLYILLKNKSTTAPALAKLLEVSVRTIYRDIEALSLAGVPVYTLPGKGGGISLMPGYTLDRAILSDAEQKELLFALESVRATDQNVAALLAKIGAAFQKTETGWIQVDFSRWGFRERDNEKFQSIKTAILEKRILTIDYSGASGRLTHRDILPARLIFKDKNWYLQAYCQSAEDFRLFKVSRIMALTLREQRFTKDFVELPPFEVDAAPGPFQPITLCLSPKMAFRAYEEFDPGCVTLQGDGSYLVTVLFPIDAWVLGYLMSFGAELTILEPASLREAVAAQAKKIYIHHKS